MSALRPAVWAVALATALGTRSEVAVAQPQDDTVQWHAILAPAQTPPSGTVSLTVEAAIQEGWHIYGFEQSPGGPTPLKISLAEGGPAVVDGPAAGDTPRKVYDKRFRLNTQFYTGRVTLRLPVRLTSTASAGVQELTVNVRYQSCSEGECRPPRTVRLTVPIEVGSHE